MRIEMKNNNDMDEAEVKELHLNEIQCEGKVYLQEQNALQLICFIYATIVFSLQAVVGDSVDGRCEVCI